MVRNIALLSGNSHPKFVDTVASILGVPPLNRILQKFSCGESRCEIRDSVRGKDVYIIQSFGCGGDSDKVNDHFMELCIMISACKMGSAKRITAVLPLFPYSRQPDLFWDGNGTTQTVGGGKFDYSYESVPASPPLIPKTATLGADITELERIFSHNSSKANGHANGLVNGHVNGSMPAGEADGGAPPVNYTTHNYEKLGVVKAFQSKPGYKLWVAQAGHLVANLITCAGADRILTCDLHESTYQGFFDIPVDNLHGRSLIQDHIRKNIENYKDAVIVSPDAGGAKRATAIADSLGLKFALIHKERRSTKIAEPPKATMMLVGDVAGHVCILVDDMADTANTIVRAAKLVKAEGATKVFAVVTHGLLSGDALARINASALDKLVVTNTVAQAEHRAACPKLDVLGSEPFFAEGIRRLHHGESISALFLRN